MWCILKKTSEVAGGEEGEVYTSDLIVFWGFLFENLEKVCVL